MDTILITGGTGLIGKKLAQLLIEKGYCVSFLSRTVEQNSNIPAYLWNIEKKYIDPKALAAAHYIIHLAGAGMADKRWTNARKEELEYSRVHSTNLLFQEIKKQNKSLKAFISSSAVGYYGSFTSGKTYTENDPPAHDFLGKTCQFWEKAANQFHKEGIRTVKLRLGVVLSDKGGALPKMAKPIKYYAGAVLGTGKQYMPWIHVDDVCAIFLKAIEDIGMNGIYNVVSPQHTTNKEFTKTLARILKKPLLLPNIPSFILKIFLGEMATMLLTGSRVSSRKLIAAGYSFQYSQLESALNDLIGK